jgi:nucleoside-diphosphate-sugar epimerase
MTSQPSHRKALVIGATGGVGGAVAARLRRSGWRVSALHRRPQDAAARPGLSGVEWRQGDAMREADVVAAAAGADLIVHAANPPGYRNWRGTALPMLASSIAAARACGGRILLPGTIYNYGPDAFPRLREDQPQRPLTRKGAIRVAMEQALTDASHDGLRVLIVRAGDYIGTSGNGWLSQGLVTPGRPASRIAYPGPPEVAHAWAYTGDVAEAMVRLAELPDLADFETFHMRGHELTGHAMRAALEAAARRQLRMTRLPWPLLAAISPFNETLRELLEMRYLWREPVLLDNARLVARLGEEPRTDLVTLLRAALAEMGCLEKAALDASRPPP